MLLVGGWELDGWIGVFMTVRSGWLVFYRVVGYSMVFKDYVICQECGAT